MRSGHASQARRTADYHVVIVEALELSHILVNGTERPICGKNSSKRNSRAHDNGPGEKIPGSSTGQCWHGTLRF
jgi:hypothetical protein